MITVYVYLWSKSRQNRTIVMHITKLVTSQHTFEHNIGKQYKIIEMHQQVEISLKTFHARKLRKGIPSPRKVYTVIVA